MLCQIALPIFVIFYKGSFRVESLLNLLLERFLNIYHYYLPFCYFELNSIVKIHYIEIKSSDLSNVIKREIKLWYGGIKIDDAGRKVSETHQYFTLSRRDGKG